MNTTPMRWGLGMACGAGLILFFLFQQANVAALAGIEGKTAVFLFNKSFRFVLNDLLMIGIIYALFGQKQYIYFALVVQAFGIVFLLIPYFVLKIYFHSGNGPLVNFLHRLVLNPTLMILLIPAFWLQSRKSS